MKDVIYWLYVASLVITAGYYIAVLYTALRHRDTHTAIARAAASVIESKPTFYFIACIAFDLLTMTLMWLWFESTPLLIAHAVLSTITICYFNACARVYAKS